MAVTVETLEKLERRITLTLPMAEDITARKSRTASSKLARTVKADGFRPGKVPMSVVAQRYGYSVQYEVINDKVGEAFNAAASEAQSACGRCAQASLKRRSLPEGQMAFDATFEVYPDVRLGQPGRGEVERASSEVTDAAIDKHA
jgi:trigger factor